MIVFLPKINIFSIFFLAGFLTIQLLGCANLNDGLILVADDIQIFRSGDSTNFLVTNRQLAFDSKRYAILQFGVQNGLLALETWDSKIERDKPQKIECIYFIIELSNNHVIRNLSFEQMQLELKKRGITINLSSPYNWTLSQ